MNAKRKSTATAYYRARCSGCGYETPTAPREYVEKMMTPMCEACGGREYTLEPQKLYSVNSFPGNLTITVTPTDDDEAKQAFAAAVKSNVAAAKHAANASELEIFRAAAARAGDAFRHRAREHYTAGDIELDNLVDAALDELVRVCGDHRAVAGGDENGGES